MQENHTLTIVGRVISTLKTLDDCPLQESEEAPPASIQVLPEFIETVKDLVAGHDIVILTWLHQADRSVLSCITRRNIGTPVKGVFSTRSPDRPNPIGLHEATVVSNDGNGLLKLSALEVLDGTPILDIKPKI